MIKINIDKCEYNEDEQNLIIKIESEKDRIDDLSNQDIYNIVTTSTYLYILSNIHQEKDMHKFDAFDLQSMLEHFPYICCILDIEVFEYFLKNDSDMFVMLESLTLQSHLLYHNEDELDLSLFKTLDQKLISKIREYKNLIMYLDNKDIDEIENIFINIFKIDLKIISYVDFKKIRNMMNEQNNKHQNLYKELLEKRVHSWIKDIILKFNYKLFNTYKFYLNNDLIYNC
ncbi:hypothetical protein IOLA_206 [uncultured bacterium]|nr:hypothetical protein IOLA_206 [uncultured bacterium]